MSASRQSRLSILSPIPFSLFMTVNFSQIQSMFNVSRVLYFCFAFRIEESFYYTLCYHHSLVTRYKSTPHPLQKIPSEAALYFLLSFGESSIRHAVTENLFSLCSHSPFSLVVTKNSYWPLFVDGFWLPSLFTNSMPLFIFPLFAPSSNKENQAINIILRKIHNFNLIIVQKGKVDHHNWSSE